MTDFDLILYSLIALFVEFQTYKNSNYWPVSLHLPTKQTEHRIGYIANQMFKGKKEQKVSYKIERMQVFLETLHAHFSAIHQPAIIILPALSSS